MHVIDDTQVASEAGLKYFIKQQPDTRTAAEKSFSDDQILGNIKDILNQKSLTEWTALTSQRKLSTALGSTRLKDSMEATYSVKRANKATVDAYNNLANPATITDTNGDPLHSTSEANRPAFVVTGTVVKFSIQPIVARSSGQKLLGNVKEVVVYTANSASEYNKLTAAAQAGDGEITLTLERSTLDMGIKPESINIVLHSNNSPAQSITYVPGKTVNGYMNHSVSLKLAHDFGLNVRNGATYTLEITPEPSLNRYSLSPQLIFANPGVISGVLPFAVPAKVTISGFIGVINAVRVLLEPITLSDLKGYTFEKHQIRYFDDDVHKLSDAQKLSPTALDALAALPSNYIGSFDVYINTAATGVDHVSNLVDGVAEPYTTQLTVSTAKRVWAMVRATTNTAGINSPWTLTDTVVEAVLKPTPPTALSLNPKIDGSLELNWTLSGEDGRNGPKGENLKQHIVSLNKYGSKVKEYPVGGSITKLILPGEDLQLGEYYSCTVKAVSKDNVPSVESAASNVGISSRPVVLNAVEILPDGRTLSVSFESNGSSIKSLLTLASFQKPDGTTDSLIHTALLPLAGINISPYIVRIPSNLLPTGATLVEGVVISADTWSSIEYKEVKK
jgi:hypothetical protein